MVLAHQSRCYYERECFEGVGCLLDRPRLKRSNCRPGIPLDFHPLEILHLPFRRTGDLRFGERVDTITLRGWGFDSGCYVTAPRSLSVKSESAIHEDIHPPSTNV